MARRTFGDYKRAIRHALGANPSTGINEAQDGSASGQLVNDALQDLCNQHAWRWRRGGPVTLSLVNGQDYIELPSDFGEIETATYPGSIANGFIATTMDTIMRYRSNTAAAAPFMFFYAVNSGNVEDSAREEGLTVCTLELYPAPTSDVTDAIHLTYFRQVDDLEDEGDIPQIPYWLDYPLLLLCRAKAMELEDDDPSSASRVAFERALTQAKMRDTRTQRRLGVMRGGLYGTGWASDPLYPRLIGDPTDAGTS